MLQSRHTHNNINMPGPSSHPACTVRPAQGAVGNMNLERKRILVVGLGRTGVALAKFLKRRGASVCVADSAHERDLSPYADEIRKLAVPMELGTHRVETFENAHLIVVSPGVSHTIDPILRARAKGVPVLGEIELASRFIRQPIVAVTGTNGKTTTTTLVAEMLKNSGCSVFVGGNIGTPLIDYIDAGESMQVVVAEISSFQLDTIETFRPSVAVLLNISQDHLERYADFRAYARSKGRIFENQQAEDTAVLNGSDPLIRSLEQAIRSRKLFFNAAEKSQNDAIIARDRILLRTRYNGTLMLNLADTKLFGRHNLENACAAALAALAAGANLRGIQAALDQFHGLPHRLEPVGSVNQIRFVNDSKATNVDAVARALECFQSPVVLIMGGRDKGGNYEPLKDLIAQRVKTLVVMGEAKSIILAALGGIVPTREAATLQNAARLAFEAAQAGDTVLLSPGCSSFDMFDSYKQRGESFRRTVKEMG